MEETGVVSRQERRLKWQGHVEEWRRSGLKASAYCAANGLNAGQFWYWRRTLSPDTQEKGDGFVEVTGDNRGHATITLMIRGATISVCEGFDPSLLREVVDCLGGA